MFWTFAYNYKRAHSLHHTFKIVKMSSVGSFEGVPLPPVGSDDGGFDDDDDSLDVMSRSEAS